MDILNSYNYAESILNRAYQLDYDFRLSKLEWTTTNAKMIDPIKELTFDDVFDAALYIREHLIDSVYQGNVLDMATTLLFQKYENQFDYMAQYHSYLERRDGKIDEEYKNLPLDKSLVYIENIVSEANRIITRLHEANKTML